MFMTSAKTTNKKELQNQTQSKMSEFFFSTIECLVQLWCFFQSIITTWKIFHCGKHCWYVGSCSRTTLRYNQGSDFFFLFNMNSLCKCILLIVSFTKVRMQTAKRRVVFFPYQKVSIYTGPLHCSQIIFRKFGIRGSINLNSFDIIIQVFSRIL